jgi:hypothetical protein
LPPKQTKRSGKKLLRLLAEEEAKLAAIEARERKERRV